MSSPTDEAPASPAGAAAPPDAPAKTSAGPTRAVGAGRGLLYITAAKIWFMVGGSAIGFVLPHLLKSKVAYGGWGFILSVASPINNVMVTATIQAVSKFASRGAPWVEGTKQAALRVQLLVGGAIALAYLLAAPWVVEIEHDPGLLQPLRLSTGVVLAYAFYAVFVGAANGAREFQKQAGLDATFTTLRALLVFGGAIALGSVGGAVAGFVAAATAVLAISIWLVGIGRVEERVPSRELVAFMAPVALYLLVTNILMFLDGWVVKRLVAEAAVAAGQTDPAAVASEAVALYTAAQSIARIPYQAILSVTFVIFPLVSQATFAADQSKTREYIDRSLRLSLVVVMAMASAVAARPDALLNFFPRGEYLPAAGALRALAFGYVCFSLLTIAGTIINGTGRTRPTTVIALVTLAADAAFTIAGVRFALSTGRDPLLWAGVATTAAMALGVVLSLGYLQRSFGASLRPLSIARTVLAAAAAIGTGRVLPLGGKVGGLVACVASGLAYVVVIVASRELGPAELRKLLRRA